MAKKTASKKKATSSKTASKKAASKKTASKKAASKKTASKKAATKKTASKKTASKKTASKKTAASETASKKATAAKAEVKKAAPKQGATGKVRVTLVRSVNGKIGRHRETVRGLGLRRMNHTVVLEDTPAVRGMIRKVSYLVRVEEA